MRKIEVVFRIVYDHDVDESQRDAFKAGMEMWNKHRGTTKFAFENAKEAAYDFRVQRGAPRHLPKEERDDREKKECASYESRGSYIWYSPDLMKQVIEQPDGTAIAGRVYAHELGHALNICHKPKSDLMREGSDEPCVVRATKMPGDIPVDDIEDAKGCGAGVRAMAREEDIVLAVLGLSRRLRQVGREFKQWAPFVPLPTLLQ